MLRFQPLSYNFEKLLDNPDENWALEDDWFRGAPINPILENLPSSCFSRYKQDFEEIEKIGEGGAGRVFKAKHKFD